MNRNVCPKRASGQTYLFKITDLGEARRNRGEARGKKEQGTGKNVLTFNLYSNRPDG
ncbi:hypothetical protein [Microcoleus sp. MON2_D5]|uniref:hypothetical protein n=1 Tax=Microcoleus sp. MON2_D5 TaxID=2818833 RepID=UPI002FD34F79